MKIQTSQLVTLVTSLSTAIGLPAILTSWVHAHLAVYTAVVIAAIVLHAVMPSLFSAPSDADKNAAGLTGVGVLLFILLLAFPAQAQTATPPPTSNGFAGGSEAVAIHYNGEWSAATIATESYDFLDFGAKKTNHVYLEGKELLAPTPGFNAYLGGITIEPDLSAIFKKTNVQAGAFSAFVSGAIGNGVPSSGGSHITFQAGGGVKYNLTGNLSWQTLRADYGRFGAQPFAVISTGLSFIFGGKS